jgi:hypothetical protein
MTAQFRVPVEMLPGVLRPNGLFRPGDIIYWHKTGEGDNPSLKLVPINEEAHTMLEELRVAKLAAAEARRVAPPPGPAVEFVPEVQDIEGEYSPEDAGVDLGAPMSAKQAAELTGAGKDVDRPRRGRPRASDSD